MMLTHVQNKKIFLIYLCVFCCLVFGLLPLQKANAQGSVPVTVVGGPGDAAGRSTARNTSKLVELVQEIRDKELETDPNNLRLQQRALAEQTNAQVSYISSGYNDGDPYFIYNVEYFIQRWSDDTAGQASDELVNSNICSAFKYDVIKTIKTNYQAANVKSINEQTSCTLDAATEGNTKAFLDGDFKSGGWGAWFAMIGNPENTPLGAELANEIRIDQEVAEKKENELREASWNNGFLSVKVCPDDGNGAAVSVNSESTTADTNTVIRDKCYITNPGIILQQQLAATLQLQQSAGFTMDPEFFNEAVNDEQLKLVNELFTNEGGLVGADFTLPDLTPDPNPDPEPDPGDNDTGTPGDIDDDGVEDVSDPDINGSGLPNSIDPDIDGDKIPNSIDPDRDGDGIPNNQDTTPNGPGGGTNDVTCDSNTFGIIFDLFQTGISVDIDFSLCDLSGFNVSLFDDLSTSQVTQMTRKISFQDAITNTLAVLEYQLQIASAFDAVEETYDDKKAPFINDSCWDLEFSEDLMTVREANLEKIPISIATVLALEALQEEYNDDGPSRQIFNDYIALIKEDLVGNKLKIQEIENRFFNVITPILNDFEDDITREENICN